MLARMGVGGWCALPEDYLGEYARQDGRKRTIWERGGEEGDLSDEM